MLGAIIGDIVGSRFEFDPVGSRDFNLFHEDCFFTDDTVMTIAVANALLEAEEGYPDLDVLAVHWMQRYGRMYPGRGYGGMFGTWLRSDDPKPYGSYGNGAAMRVSACGHVAKDVDEARQLARKVTGVTHDHPEGMKAAEATAEAIVMARHGESKQTIHDHLASIYEEARQPLSYLRTVHGFDETCQGTMPVAIRAFYESEDFEEAIRLAVSAGGDADTLGAITGSMAGAYHGIPDDMVFRAMAYLDDRLRQDVLSFLSHYPSQSRKTNR